MLNTKILSILIVLLLSYNIFANANILKDNNKSIIIVPNGMLTVKPIISDETFQRIAKKNNLSSKDFTKEDLEKLDKKFAAIASKLEKQKVFEKINKIAPKYGLKPETVAACIIGEHVFNVNLVDTFQSYFINVYSKWINKHDPSRDKYIKFISEPEIAIILKDSNRTDYEKWDTIFSLYNNKYRGKNGYSNDTFLMSFFNPMRAGLTYGLGQLSPIRILLTNDIAHKYGGLDKIDPKDTNLLYKSTLDIDLNINYVAANALVEIETYKKYANCDISNNIGVIATLYNLGEEKQRAIKLNNINIKREKDNMTYSRAYPVAKGSAPSQPSWDRVQQGINGKGQTQELELPKENFYGWFMNRKENDIKKLLSKS